MKHRAARGGKSDLALVSLLLLVAFPAGVRSQEGSSAPPTHLRQLLSQSELTRMGLNKLSAAEIAALDTWLTAYTKLMVQRSQRESVTSRPSRMPSVTSDVVESTISGEFHGWEGESIFKLDNGQIWQQAEYDYNYEYAYRPDVVIYKTREGYRMKVEDVEETILVRRIK